MMRILHTPVEIAVLGLLSCALWIAVPANSQEPVEEGAKLQANDADAARKVLKETIARYRRFSSYQDAFTIEMKMVTGDEGDGGMFGGDSTTTGTFVFAAPNRIRSISDQFAVYSDGKKVWQVFPAYQQFTETAATSGKIDLGAGGGMMMGPSAISTHPLAKVFLDPKTPFDDALKVVELSGVRSVKRSGKPGKRVSGRVRIEGPMLGGTMPFSVWIDEATGLIEELRIDMTRAFRSMMSKQPWGDEAGFEPPEIERAEVVITLSKIEVDKDVSSVSFSFEPGASDFKVDQFDPMAQPPTPHPLDLIGEPAPAFEAKALDGRTIKLESLRGKVVILHFWARWSRACVDALPALDGLRAAKGGSKPFDLIHINRDGKAAGDKVRELAGADELRPAHVLDPQGVIARMFNVGGVPSIIVIDPKGIVADVHVTYPDDPAKVLGDQVDQLLSGKPLYSEEALAERIEEFEESRDGYGAPLVTVALRDFEPQRLVEESRTSIQAFGAYNIRRLDLDGDGVDELVMQGSQGNLEVIKGDGSGTETIRFMGLNRMSQLSAFETVRMDGQRFWFVASTRYGGGFGGDMSQKSTVGLYAETGQPIWSVVSETAEGAQVNMIVATGDLTGDDVPEFIVGLTTYKMRKMDQNSWSNENQKSYLLVLDRHGEPLAQRRLGQNISLLHVAGSPGGSKPRLLLCLADGNLYRFRLRLTPDGGALERDAEVEPPRDGG